ncbi:hypothetical protein KR009_007242 [Drosophila setifemur]|nr:hypothetical protein KR009_007242 [Drosophila setifemur]
MVSLNKLYGIEIYVKLSFAFLGVPGFLNITTAPFLKIGDGYYFIESNLRKNWFDAYESCRKMGAGLIDFESIEEWTAINKYLLETEIVFKTYWTSGNDLANDRTFNWFVSGQPISLDIWQPGEPNNLNGNEHCVDIAKPNDPGINDRNCTIKSYYICKAPKSQTASFVIW